VKILFRCDANEATGLGHLSRSLALAEALRRAGGEALFLGHWSGPAFVLLDSAGFKHRAAEFIPGTAEDAAELARCVIAEGADGACVDSYAIDASWLANVTARGVAAVLIDDFGQLSDYSECAGVLNFTVKTERLDYPGLASELRALGPDYFPARENLLRLRLGSGARSAPSPSRILIALGGGDRLGLTLPLYRALQRLQPGVQVRALLPDGPARAAAQGLNVGDFPAAAGDLAAHYAWAGACVTGGGLVKYECAYLGLPMAIFSQSPEQQVETDRFIAAGFGYDLAPGGRAEGWEARLGEFLRHGPYNLITGHRFPADGADRAMAALCGFLRRAATLATPL
jgi:UDP-2,4-diacetamido-2,4,6-trideoxy-beta-L-altropyranose hydrolase